MSSSTYTPFLGTVEVGTATSAEGVTSSSLAVQYKDENGALQTFVADQASLTKLVWGIADYDSVEADINAWRGSQIPALRRWSEAIPPPRYNDLCLLAINTTDDVPTDDASPRANGHLMVFRQTVPVGGTVTSEICHMCDLDLAEEVDRPETTVENHRALYSRGMSGDYYVPLSKCERIRFPVSGTLLGHVDVDVHGDLVYRTEGGSLVVLGAPVWEISDYDGRSYASGTKHHAVILRRADM